jgi:hypothetical protein
MELVVDPSLQPPLASEMGFDLLDMSPVNAAPNLAMGAEPQAPSAASTTAASAPAAVDESSEGIKEAFENDPLIQAAIQKFSLKLAARA